jgi:hypothetical protein
MRVAVSEAADHGFHNMLLVAADHASTDGDGDGDGATADAGASAGGGGGVIANGWVCGSSPRTLRLVADPEVRPLRRGRAPPPLCVHIWYGGSLIRYTH